jgi:hypothetical protein
MQRNVQLGVFTVTFASAAQVFAQTAASAPVPPASGVQPLAGTPGGAVTWFVAGLAIGLVVGYMIGKKKSADQVEVTRTT